MMKRMAFVVLVCLSVCAALIFSGCSDDNNAPVVGEWMPSTVSIGGTTVSYNDLDTKGRDFGFVFNSDGSCKITIGGIRNDGTYTFNETSVDLQYGGKTQKLSYDEGILTLKLTYHDQTTSYMFTKVTK